MPRLGGIVDLTDNSYADYRMARGMGEDLGTMLGTMSKNNQIDREIKEREERDGQLTTVLIQARRDKLDPAATLEAMGKIPKAARSAIYKEQLKAFQAQKSAGQGGGISADVKRKIDSLTAMRERLEFSEGNESKIAQIDEMLNRLTMGSGGGMAAGAGQGQGGPTLAGGDPEQVGMNGGLGNVANQLSRDYMGENVGPAGQGDGKLDIEGMANRAYATMFGDNMDGPERPEIPLNAEGQPDVNPKAGILTEAAANMPDLPNPIGWAWDKMKEFHKKNKPRNQQTDEGIEEVTGPPQPRHDKMGLSLDEYNQQSAAAQGGMNPYGYGPVDDGGGIPTKTPPPQDTTNYDMVEADGLNMTKAEYAKKYPATQMQVGTPEFNAYMDSLPDKQKTPTLEQATQFIDEAKNRMPNASRAEIIAEAEKMMKIRGWIIN